MNIKSMIYVPGHKGMLGSAMVRALLSRGYENLVLRTREECDLLDAKSVKELFDEEKPEVVIHAAARVGGIRANIEHPAEFLYENLQIQNNVIHQSYLNNVKIFCFLGSSCIYPRECPQPMKEEYLLNGPLEPTNEAYALAKISGLKMVEYYRKQYGFNGINLMPCNLYGTNDHFAPEHSHVLAALVKKMVDAVDANMSQVTLWGTGAARREFMHVDDAAEGVLFLIDKIKSAAIVNLGCGEDITIKALAEKIAGHAGYHGELIWDRTKPDGMPRKCMDISKMRSYGFSPKISLDEGIKRMIHEYRNNQ